MPPHLLRRLAAIVYDTLLLVAVLFAASYPVVVLLGGEAVTPGNPFYLLYLLLVSYSYFDVTWTRSGQTLDMLTWRIKLVRPNGGRIDHRIALYRFGAALLSWAAAGAGFAWSLVDKRRRTWHDILSGTELVLTPKPRSGRTA